MKSKTKALRIQPNPGSDKAIELGCTCPVLDNARGYGARGNRKQFWISMDCPLHNPPLVVRKPKTQKVK